MEIEATPSAPAVAKKLWNIVRIVMLMLRKGIAKSKPISDLNLLLKRGKLAITTTLTRHHHHFSKRCKYDDVLTASAVQRVLEMLNNNNNNNNSFGDVAVEGGNYSPFVPGFGKSPIGVKKLRITDSPFPLKEEEEEGGGANEVDVAAEEFIKRFYKNLHSQIDAAMDSPINYNYNYYHNYNYNYSWVR